MLSTFPSPSFCINLILHHKTIRVMQCHLKMVQLVRDDRLMLPG